MIRSEYRKLNSRRRSHVGLVLALAFLVVGGVSFATMPRAAVAGSSGPPAAMGADERVNHRISVRGPKVATANVAATNLLPFASITVDRTDDVFSARSEEHTSELQS